MLWPNCQEVEAAYCGTAQGINVAVAEVLGRHPWARWVAWGLELTRCLADPRPPG